jgi:hypothetical protein
VWGRKQVAQKWREKLIKKGEAKSTGKAKKKKKRERALRVIIIIALKEEEEQKKEPLSGFAFCSLVFASLA